MVQTWYKLFQILIILTYFNYTSNIIWRSPEIGEPSDHPNFSGINDLTVPYPCQLWGYIYGMIIRDISGIHKPSSYGGPLMAMETPISLPCRCTLLLPKDFGPIPVSASQLNAPAQRWAANWKSVMFLDSAAG